jgi:hypothetical protein
MVAPRFHVQVLAEEEDASQLAMRNDLLLLLAAPEILGNP